jgi:ABC-type uncharacterized transport system permease subunit
MPSSLAIQLALLLVTSLLFAAAFVLGLRHMRRSSGAVAEARMAVAGGGSLPHEASMGPQARAAVVVGTLLGIGLFFWRAAAAGSFTLPLTNPFDAFLALGLLVAFVLIYFRWTRHLRSFSFFLLPMVIILFLLGAVIGVAHPNADKQDFSNAWFLLHIITIFAGTICFVLGAVGGIIYLLADRQLRRKGLDASHRWIGLPPLASIEKINRWMVYVGFPLLTVATIAGILRFAQAKTGAMPPAGSFSQDLKIGLGTLSWLVYAVLLHVPLNPRFRGPRAAWLYIVGFVFFLGAFAAARWS